MDHMLPFENENRTILIRKEGETDPGLGCTPEKRSTEALINYGVVNINKPVGPTSHQVSEYVQKILEVSKAGHSGTLDPGVHGCLPTALGKATRIAQMLLTSGKEYVGIMHMHKDVDEQIVKDTIKKHFLGTIKQLPPIKSAVKRELRPRTIYYFDILEKDEKDVLFIVGCQAGTYIRKLLHDLGQKLRVGAHMAELRRTKAGPFNESTLCTLQDLSDAYHYYKEEKNDTELRKLIQPVENATNHISKIWVFDGAVDTICHGANLNMPGISKVHDTVKEGSTIAIMTLKDEFVGLGTSYLSGKEISQSAKGLAVKMDKVFMEPGMYKITTP